MEKKACMSTLIYLGIAICFLASMAMIDSAKGAPAPTSGPRYGGTLRVSNQYDGISIGYPPKLARVASNRQVAPAIESLFRFDNTGKTVPWLATGSENSVETKTITLTLRKGVKFHDGTDFNAEAVKWNLSQCMAARTGGTGKFKAIDVIDDYTVRINLTEWDSTVISNLAQTLGMMISPAAYKKNGEEWCAKNPVGTGPFQFVSWEKDVRTVYKKFPDYWQKGKPYLDRIEWILIVDTLTQELSLRRGETDIILTLASKPLAGLEKDGLVVTGVRMGSGVRGLVPDSVNPKSPFADVRVRQAAQYAIDTEAIVKAIFYGKNEPINQYVSKAHWGYNPSVVGYPYNPTKARQLLAEAGYPNGFKTKILWLSTPEDDQVFAAVQGYFKAVGIDAELDPAPGGRYDQTTSGGKWEGLLMASRSGNPDVVAPLAMWYSGSGKYYTQMLVPDDYAKAIQNAVTASDFRTKQKWTQEAMKLMIDKYCLLIPIFCGSEFAVSQPSVRSHGFMETPFTGMWTPEDAWLSR